MKTLVYGIAVIAFWVSGLSYAEDKKSYNLQKVVAYHRTNAIPRVKEGNRIHLNSGGIQLDDSCVAKIKGVKEFRYDELFGITTKLAGGDKEFNRILEKAIGISFHDFANEISSFYDYGTANIGDPFKHHCEFIPGVAYTTKAGDMVVLDDDYIYFFKYHPAITYTVTPLPITDLAISCIDKGQCDKHLVRYDNDHPRFEEPNVTFFYRLPSINDIEVYLGWENIGADEVGTLVYLITIKGNKLNYVCIGKEFTKYTKFLIAKDYSVIEGIDLHGKPAKFAIKSNGVIIKKP